MTNPAKEVAGKDDFVAKRILVTGGAGFLGSWLCDILVAENGNVHCVDNLSAGLKDNIKHLIGTSHFTFTTSYANTILCVVASNPLSDLRPVDLNK